MHFNAGKQRGKEDTEEAAAQVFRQGGLGSVMPADSIDSVLIHESTWLPSHGNIEISMIS